MKRAKTEATHSRSKIAECIDFIDVLTGEEKT